MRTRCRISRGTTLRVREQVNPVAQLRRLKFRVEGQFRDIPLPLYVADAMDKHIVGQGIPITEVSRWLGHKSIEVTNQINAASSLPPGTAPAPSSMTHA